MHKFYIKIFNCIWIKLSQKFWWVKLSLFQRTTLKINIRIMSRVINFFKKVKTNKITSIMVIFHRMILYVEFAGGLTTILPMQIREVKFVFHQTDVSGLILCSIMTGDNTRIIDQEIIENSRSYKLYKLAEYFVIQLTGENSIQYFIPFQYK